MVPTLSLAVRELSLASLAVAAAAGCEPDVAPPPSTVPVESNTTARAPATAPTGTPDVSGASPAGRILDGGRDAATLDRAGRSALLAALNAGRERASAKNWEKAFEALDRALAIDPTDARVLSEIAWVALHAGRLERGEDAAAQALKSAHEPTLRAQILYNAGRLAEAAGRKEHAQERYRGSLELRDHAEVTRRLVALGGKPPDAESAPPPEPLPCVEGAASFEGLCACLLGKADMLFRGEENASKCETDRGVDLGHERMAVLLWGEAMPGQRLHLLVAHDGTTFRPVAELGRDFEPGAFGVHNEARVTGASARQVGGRTVVVVKSVQDDFDQNLGGLEACTHLAKQETVCALGLGDAPTRCTQPIHVHVESGCHPGDHIDPKELDADMLEALQDIRARAEQSTAAARYRIEDDGRVVVTLVSGKRRLIPAGTIGTHRLF